MPFRVKTSCCFKGRCGTENFEVLEIYLSSQTGGLNFSNSTGNVGYRGKGDSEVWDLSTQPQKIR